MDRLLMKPARTLLFLAVLVLAAAMTGCQPSRTPAATTPVPAPSTNFCVSIGGSWDEPQESCRLTTTNGRGLTAKIAMKYPAGLVDNSSAPAPALRAHLQKWVAEFQPPQSPQKDTAGEGSANLAYTATERPGVAKSVVLRSDWFIPGMAHPNSSISTFTFSLKDGAEIRLTDLFCAGIDPVKALPPLVRPYIQHSLDTIGGSFAQAFRAEDFEPSTSPGSLANNYQAWALDGDNLVLYMPGEGGPAGMPAGFLQPHIPFTALNSILREGTCAAS